MLCAEKLTFHQNIEDAQLLVQDAWQVMASDPFLPDIAGMISDEGGYNGFRWY